MIFSCACLVTAKDTRVNSTSFLGAPVGDAAVVVWDAGLAVGGGVGVVMVQAAMVTLMSAPIRKRTIEYIAEQIRDLLNG